VEIGQQDQGFRFTLVSQAPQQGDRLVQLSRLREGYDGRENGGRR
jgi:hypothetical protein